MVFKVDKEISMVHNLATESSIVSEIIAEIRDVSVQNDRMRFRRNIERVGELIAYEISKKLEYTDVEIETPLGTAQCSKLKEQPVLATILRAGLPLHQGLLNMFDKADNGFISAYRKHHKSGEFTIRLEYVSCPDLTDRVLIISDPMLATGGSMLLTIQELLRFGKPKHVHIVCAIASTEGIDYIRKNLSNYTIWTAAVDEELTAKSYIVPGLGDAGDLAFGVKIQS